MTNFFNHIRNIDHNSCFIGEDFNKNLKANENFGCNSNNNKASCILMTQGLSVVSTLGSIRDIKIGMT